MNFGSIHIVSGLAYLILINTVPINLNKAIVDFMIIEPKFFKDLNQVSTYLEYLRLCNLIDCSCYHLPRENLNYLI